jgi:hypothetical protein
VGSSSFILSTCPAHFILEILAFLEISTSLYKLYSSWLYLFLHVPFSWMGP